MGPALSTSMRLRCRTWGSAWAFSRSARLRVPRLRRDCLAVAAYTWSTLAPDSAAKREPSLTGVPLSMAPPAHTVTLQLPVRELSAVLRTGPKPEPLPEPGIRTPSLASQDAMIEAGWRTGDAGAVGPDSALQTRYRRSRLWRRIAPELGMGPASQSQRATGGTQSLLRPSISAAPSAEPAHWPPARGPTIARCRQLRIGHQLHARTCARAVASSSAIGSASRAPRLAARGTQSRGEA